MKRFIKKESPNYGFVLFIYKIFVIPDISSPHRLVALSSLSEGQTVCSIGLGSKATPSSICLISWEEQAPNLPVHGGLPVSGEFVHPYTATRRSKQVDLAHPKGWYSYLLYENAPQFTPSGTARLLIAAFRYAQRFICKGTPAWL